MTKDNKNQHILIRDCSFSDGCHPLTTPDLGFVEAGTIQLPPGLKIERLP